MMDIRKISILSLIFLSVSLSLFGKGQNDAALEQDGVEYHFDDFSGIEGSASFNIEVRQSDNYSLIVYADKSTMDKVSVKKKGRTLVLGMKPLSGLSWNSSPKAVITMPVLESIELSGASSLIAAGFQSDKRLFIDISGASTVELDISAKSASIDLSGASRLRAVMIIPEINLELSGSSDIELTGIGKVLKCDMSGASSAVLRDYKLSSASIELSGSSDIYLNLDGTLDLDASAASTLYYRGNVILGAIELSGTSSIIEE